MKSSRSTILGPSLRSVEALEFQAALRRKMVGQGAAIEAVTEIYQIVLAGLNPPGRPVGNLLFLGPTGSGKTRMVEAVNQWHTEKLKLSILLFDEIEKASDTLWQLLLGVLDKATLTLGDNRRVDLSRSISFMTSNLGKRNGRVGQRRHGIRTQPWASYRPRGKNRPACVPQKIPPEFMNRIDKAVVFHPLLPEHLLEQILEIELCLVQERASWTAPATSNLRSPVRPR